MEARNESFPFAGAPDALRRRLLVLAGAVALLPLALGASEIRPRRVVWVMYLGTEESRKRFGDPRDRIRGFVKSRGLVEGRDVVLEFMDVGAGNTPGDGEALAGRLVSTRPDIIVMVANSSLMFLKRRLGDIPVVFYDLGTDPSKLGLVESLRRPGANFTGSTLDYGNHVARNWQLLKECVPWMKRGGQVFSQEMRLAWEAAGERDAIAAAWVNEEREARRNAEAKLGISIVPIPVPPKATMEEVVASIRSADVQGVYLEAYTEVPPDYADVLKAARIPAVSIAFGPVRRGILVGSSWERDEGPRYAVAAVERILRGENPATIPVYQQREWGVAVNRATARAMGIEIPASILIQALEVID